MLITAAKVGKVFYAKELKLLDCVNGSFCFWDVLNYRRSDGIPIYIGDRSNSQHQSPHIWIVAVSILSGVGSSENSKAIILG